MKVGAKKLQIKTNTARKKDLNVKGRIIFDALMQRTQLKAVDATSLKGGKESIVKLFSNLGEVGIEEGDVSFFQVTANIRLQGVCARGGLSVIEGKSLNKTIVSYKWTLCNSRKKRVQVLDKKKSTGRILKRPSLERKSALVYLDGKGDIYLIHLLNILDPAAVESRKEHVESKTRVGWSKSCSLSGIYIASQSFDRFKKNVPAQKSYFGANSRMYKVVGAEVTGKGKGTTAKLEYKNRQGKTKYFQFGNYLRRDISNRYGRMHFVHFSWKILCKTGPLIYDPNKVLSERADIRNIHLATNEWPAGTEAPPCWHQDANVTSACVVSAMPYSDCELNSVDNANADAGQLAHEIGGLIHPYHHNDLIVFRGDHYHGPVTPVPRRFGVMGEKAGRYSFVVFHKHHKT